MALMASTASWLACTNAPPASARRTLTISTGGRGGTFFPIGTTLAGVLRAGVPDWDFTVTTGGGAVGNLERLQNGEADLAFSFADAAYTGYAGHLPGQSAPYGRVRAVSLLQLAPIQIVVHPNSGIRTVTDLAGKRVTAGTPTNGSRFTASLILSAFGVDPNTVEFYYDGAPSGVVTPFTERRIDAMFVLARYPNELIASAIAAGGELLEISGPSARQLHLDAPFFKFTSIPHETYPGLGQSVATLGVDSLLLCRSDLDANVVYQVTKALFGAVTEGRHDTLRPIDLETAAAAPIPLHAGALRFFRERELFP